MKIQAAFLFIAPEANPKTHRTVVDTPVITLTTVGVKNYAEAQKVAVQLVEQGVTALELCAGFGNEGVGLVSKAVAGKAAVGVVRFDAHPGLGFKSGDTLF
ncbi:DUF6506 family protein [Desulfovibrio cuneatus]|uniref:DUF6506 family protein n=1 Tax=Desulfovibrio cuneatus TaxID=159728 RepID=UPI0004091071|nr:DUF6506 family protein [Desulfovibrio cuneatus]